MPTTIQVDSVLTIVSLILGIFSIAISVLAFWLSLYFHKQSTQLFQSLNKIVCDIEASTKLTEVTSRNLIDPIIRSVLDMVQAQQRSSIDTMRPEVMKNIAETVERVLKETPPQARRETREALLKEAEQLLSTMKQRTSLTEIHPNKESSIPISTDVFSSQLIPGATSYNWMPFIRRIRDLGIKNKFLSVKMLRDKVFSNEPQTQEALQIAIDKNMLITYYVDNPKKPSFPTLACKPNLDHPLIHEIMLALDKQQS